MLFGSLLIVDLRLIGFAGNLSFQSFAKLIRLTVIGFGINLTTGVIFLFGDPERYFINIAFKIKMLLILVALVNALYVPFRLKKIPNNPFQTGNSSIPIDIKLVACMSLLLWTSVIILGRFIPYVE
jgi:hypothetical protein